MLPSSLCRLWQPDRAANAAQDNSSYTTAWGMIYTEGTSDPSAIRRGGACGLCGSEWVNRRIGYARLWLAHSFRPFSRKPPQRDTGTPLRDLTMTDNRRLPLIPRRDRDQPAVSLEQNNTGSP
jgi:hypothetical protein